MDLGSHLSGGHLSGSHLDSAQSVYSQLEPGHTPCLLELLLHCTLDPNKWSGCSQVLSETKDQVLITVVKRDFCTQRMCLKDLSCEAGLASSISEATTCRVLKYGSYCVNFLFHLDL